VQSREGTVGCLFVERERVKNSLKGNSLRSMRAIKGEGRRIQIEPQSLKEEREGVKGNEALNKRKERNPRVKSIIGTTGGR